MQRIIIRVLRGYVEETRSKSELDRGTAKDKTGQFTGAYAINPVNKEKIPIYIADYVLASYGTGAQSWLFLGTTLAILNSPPSSICQSCKSFSRRIPKLTGRVSLTKEPRSTRRMPKLSLNDLSTAEAKKKITAWLETKGLGKKTINYKLRDWLFSRQRYWGEPFPIIWKRDTSGNLYHEALPESALPLFAAEAR